jgi:hypothetical protein
MARPRKNPDALKVKVTLTLEPRVYQAAREATYRDGVSISEKIDQLLGSYLADAHPDIITDAAEQSETRANAALRIAQQGVAKMLRKKAEREGSTQKLGKAQAKPKGNVAHARGTLVR